MDQYIAGQEIFYENVIKSIKKSTDSLRPLYEVVTNAFESVSQRADAEKQITIQLHFGKSRQSERALQKIIVIDNGVGFDKENFERFKRWGDNRKGPNNRGSGRVQVLHAFGFTKYVSTFFEQGQWIRREFALSKEQTFIFNNAIIKHISDEILPAGEYQTKVELSRLWSEKDQLFYSSLTAESLKQALISHFLLFFVPAKRSLPLIKIEEFFNGMPTKEPEWITADDIPDVDKSEPIRIPYKTLDEKGRIVPVGDKFEIFTLNAFKVSSDKCRENSLRLTSNGQIVVGAKVKLECLRPRDAIGSNRFVFLISGEYLDRKDGDNRGEFRIPSGDELKELGAENSNLIEPEIIIEDIVERANQKIVGMYEEIKKADEQKFDELQKLKEMFLISQKTIDSVRIDRNDSDEKILMKLYREEAANIAKHDAIIKAGIDKLASLDITSPKCSDALDEIVEEIADAIPAQNKQALSKYVARRKMVLELFEKVRQGKMQAQLASERKSDEKLLHNLLYHQGSKQAEQSNLWILSEEYIYFSGNSELRIKDLEVNGQKIIKQDMTPEEEEFCSSYGRDKRLKRPDIFLYPEEGKCILIELKSPNANVSEHLSQLNMYAGILRNLTIPRYEITNFYGYLIGENFDLNEVRIYDSDFKFSPRFKMVFRSSKPVIGLFGRSDGDLYTEVIKYSEILRRAQLRNAIFIKKLGLDDPDGSSGAAED